MRASGLPQAYGALRTYWAFTGSMAKKKYAAQWSAVGKNSGNAATLNPRFRLARSQELHHLATSKVRRVQSFHSKGFWFRTADLCQSPLTLVERRPLASRDFGVREGAFRVIHLNRFGGHHVTLKCSPR